MSLSFVDILLHGLNMPTIGANVESGSHTLFIGDFGFESLIGVIAKVDFSKRTFGHILIAKRNHHILGGMALGDVGISCQDHHLVVEELGFALIGIIVDAAVLVFGTGIDLAKEEHVVGLIGIVESFCST